MCSLPVISPYSLDSSLYRSYIFIKKLPSTEIPSLMIISIMSKKSFIGNWVFTGYSIGFNLGFILAGYFSNYLLRKCNLQVQLKKTWLIRILLLIVYCVPYAFFAIKGDAISGTMMFYGVMIVGFSLLCWGAIKTNNHSICIYRKCSKLYFFLHSSRYWGIRRYAWYFKPFTVQTLLIGISIVVVVCKRKEKQSKK